MSYVALYRQWRPQDFDNLVGQNHISKTLMNALTVKKIAHAYLFAGPRGTGKTSTAKILAKALNCVNGPTPNPCNQCANCRRITEGNSMDVFEVDAASNRGIDEIRDLRETVKFAPVDGRYKVYIIDEVHMLTTEAFNALLKTLEEPPAHVVFILATTEAHKIPATIHSRCQRYDFRRISVQEICARLTEVAAQSDLAVTEDALKLIAVHADGGMRDALSVLDQCGMMEAGVVDAVRVRQMLGLVGHEWIWQLTGYIADKQVGPILLLIDELIAMGKDVRQILLELAMYVRSLMLSKAAPNIDSVELYTHDKAVLAAHNAKFSAEELSVLAARLNETISEVKWAPEPRIIAEMALISFCSRQQEQNIDTLIERIAVLEEKLARITSNNLKADSINQVPAPKIQADTANAPMESKPAKAYNDSQTAMPVRESAAGKGAEGLMPAKAASSDAKSIWDKILKELIANGKRSVHACVAQGQLIELTNTQAVIQFTGRFPKERTEKDDYRSLLEGSFSKICGQQIKVSCVMGAAASPAPAEKKASQAVIKESNAANNAANNAAIPVVNQAEHPALQKAIMMFGGKVIKKEKED